MNPKIFTVKQYQGVTGINSGTTLFLTISKNGVIRISNDYKNISKKKKKK